MSSDHPRWPWATLDHETAAPLLREHVPGADQELTSLGAGDFCLAFRVNGRILRVARHAEAAAALRRETCVLAAIADSLPVPVPRPTFSLPDTCPPFTLHDEIAGEVLTREAWTRMPTRARRRIAGELARFLRALHETGSDVDIQCGLRLHNRREAARRLFDAAVEGLYPLLDREIRGRLDAVLTLCSSQPPDVGRPSVLLHCDIAPGHVLVDPAIGKLTGVIDFGDVAMGEPARDFIYIYEDFGPALLAEVLDSYVPKRARSFLRDIRTWYLLEALSWTLEMLAQGRPADANHGLAEIRGELATLPDLES
jgi:aminoglycoside 2''-phosphotransferase